MEEPAAVLTGSKRPLAVIYGARDADKNEPGRHDDPLAMYEINVHPSWRAIVATELRQEYIPGLFSFVSSARRKSTVFPPAAHVFTALALTDFNAIKVVILGQDPYHGAGQAHGLAFSVPDGVAIPPSLRNIIAEVAADIGSAAGSSTMGSVPPAIHGKPKPKALAASSGNLAAWARQGVLLLNAVLTVESGNANSHAAAGWEAFTTALIAAVSQHRKHVVFLLWGKPAQAKGAAIDRSGCGGHLVLEAPHPSPLSAHRGFLGCRHFSQANAFLVEHGIAPVDWSLPPAKAPSGGLLAAFARRSSSSGSSSEAHAKAASGKGSGREADDAGAAGGAGAQPTAVAAAAAGSGGCGSSIAAVTTRQS